MRGACLPTPTFFCDKASRYFELCCPRGNLHTEFLPTRGEEEGDSDLVTLPPPCTAKPSPCWAPLWR